MSTLGSRIREARLASGMKQSDLAESLGVSSKAVISNWESNKNKPNADQIIAICHILEVTPSFLLDYHTTKVEVSRDEQDLIKNYRQLDTKGQTHVKNVVEHELSRVREIEELRNSVPNQSDLAAHRREDLDLAEEQTPIEELEKRDLNYLKDE